MKHITDSTVPFIIGLAVGFLITAITIISALDKTKEQTLNRACGSCDQRAETCGDFTCTKDGWR